MSERVRQVVIGAAIAALLGVVVVGLATRPAPDRNRVAELEQRLRCPVCKSVSISESPSATAFAMRRIIASQVAADRTDEQVIAYFRSRYGDWVLLDPPRSGRTLALWLLPPAAVAILLLVAATRQRRSAGPGSVEAPGLSAEEQAVLEDATVRLRERRGTGDGGPS